MRHTVYTSSAIDTTGSAGSATGSTTLVIPRAGHLEWVYHDFHASAPATTDVTGAFATTPPGGTIWTSSNSATDALQFPRAAVVNTAGVAISNTSAPIMVFGPLTISVAQCDALTGAVAAVYVCVREE